TFNFTPVFSVIFSAIGPFHSFTGYHDASIKSDSSVISSFVVATSPLLLEFVPLLPFGLASFPPQADNKDTINTVTKASNRPFVPCIFILKHPSIKLIYIKAQFGSNTALRSALTLHRAQHDALNKIFL